MNAILNYLVHLALAALLLVVFFKAYTWMTPYDEVKLIRQGNHAAALSLGGAMRGGSKVPDLSLSAAWARPAAASSSTNRLR